MQQDAGNAISIYNIFYFWQIEVKLACDKYNALYNKIEKIS